MEENEAKFVKPKQSDKEKAELIAELNCDVGKIKQEQIAINVSVQDGISMVKSPTCSELQVTSQSSISPPIEGNSENSSNVTQPTHAGSKLLEDRQTNEFLISVNKKEISDMMKQHDREKKLLHESTHSSQDQDELSISQNNSSILLEDSAKTETNISSLQSSIKLNVYRAGETQVLPKDTKVSHDYIVAQDFIQEFKKGIQEIIAKDNVSDQTARKQLFQDIIKHLSGITLETLRKRIQRAIKIYKLFEKIGVDRIKNIKSYSADSISKFTNPQIQIILDYFSGSSYADRKLKKPNSYSGCKNVEKVKPKVPFEKSHEFVPKKLPDIVLELPAKAKYFYLSLFNSDRHNDRYEFKNSGLCPECGKKHDKGKIVGRCIKSSYYIKCQSLPREKEIKVSALPENSSGEKLPDVNMSTVSKDTPSVKSQVSVLPSTTSSSQINKSNKSQLLV
ncbi:uncharacterized protein OCT59_014038 [Rhizophagus irregularis]|uniref:uncharacterized protein n=1 Tax=Rhizophagus irregularis TaxID=588596 RepID=UPI0033273299|nr:hypothetical protein OCT59_014038 [Rhizophagus irregularis]